MNATYVQKNLELLSEVTAEVLMYKNLHLITFNGSGIQHLGEVHLLGLISSSQHIKVGLPLMLTSILGFDFVYFWRAIR